MRIVNFCLYLGVSPSGVIALAVLIYWSMK